MKHKMLRRRETSPQLPPDAFQKQKKGLNRLSVRWQILIMMSFLIILTLVMLWLIQVVLLDKIYQNVKAGELSTVASNVIAGIDTDDMESIVAENCREHSCCILLTDQLGNELYSYDNRLNCVIHNMARQEIVQKYLICLRHGGGVIDKVEDRSMRVNDWLDVNHFSDLALQEKQKSETSEMESDSISGQSESADQSDNNSTLHYSGMVYYIIVTAEGQSDRLLMIDTQLTPLNTTTEVLSSSFVYVTIGMLMLTIILTLLLDARISNPISHTTQAAHRLAAGNYDVEFKGSGYKEINELNDVLNYAAGELSRTERLKHELIANVSHDLRTPLTLIIGYAEMMRDLPEEYTPENVQIIIDEATRLTGLVNDMLNLSKLQSGSNSIVPDVFCLTADVEKMLLRYSKLVEQKGYFICWHHDQDVWVCADESKIMQVLYNLINNAVNYCGPDKTIDIYQTIHQDHVRINIVDHGAGISQEDLKYIWDRYYKIDKVHRRAMVGTGLGLSIVRSILEAHNAEYGVDSSVGQGSNFWFSLPLFRDEEEARDAMEELTTAEENETEDDENK